MADVGDDFPLDCNVEVVTAGNAVYEPANWFEDLNLTPELLQGLYTEMNFVKPSRIQSVSLPMILTPPFKNMVAQAHTGSGKTTCFILGMLKRVDPTTPAPQALCICPTRELAFQNMEVLQRIGKFTGITSELAIPTLGTPTLKRDSITAHVVIGTPYTIRSLAAIKKLNLDFMKILVFDDADHTFAEGGFRDVSKNMVKNIGCGCQVLSFSTTSSKAVEDFVDQAISDYNQLLAYENE